MSFANPSYFVKISTGDQQGVMYYSAQDRTEVWNRAGQSQGLFSGNQLNRQCNLLETAGYQVDLNPGWQVPANP